jgi:hypothetical protein
MRAIIRLAALVLFVLGIALVGLRAQEPTATDAAVVTEEYTVQRGDTLFRLAGRFNTTVREIMRLNNLSNPNLIRVGQVLLVPSAAQPATTVPATPLPTAEATADTAAEATPVAALPTQAAPLAETARGVEVFVTGQSLEDVVALVNDLDVEWIKLVMNWRDVELVQGTLNVDVYDAAIEAFAAQGKSILLTLTGAPDWARPSATPFVLGLGQYGPPDDVATFAAFAAQIAERYGNRVAAYEIWQEPNLRRSWIDARTTSRDDARLSPIAYLDLLKAASQAIRAVNPEAVIVSAGLAPTGLTSIQNAYSDRLFLRDLLRGGLLEWADAVGVEPDGFANPPDARCCEASEGVLTHYEQSEFYFYETLNDYRNLLDANGGAGVPLWPTRFGWGTADGNTLVSPNMDENPFLTYTNQAEQAAYTLRAFELGQELGYVGPMFLYNLNGCVVGNQEGCFYSLITVDGTPKAVGQALGLGAP